MSVKGENGQNERDVGERKTKRHSESRNLMLLSVDDKHFQTSILKMLKLGHAHVKINLQLGIHKHTLRYTQE